MIYPVLFALLLLYSPLSVIGCQSSSLQPPVPLRQQHPKLLDEPNRSKIAAAAAATEQQQKSLIKTEIPNMIGQGPWEHVLLNGIQPLKGPSEDLVFNSQHKQFQQLPAYDDSQPQTTTTTLLIPTTTTMTSTITAPMMADTNCNAATVLALTNLAYNEATLEQNYASLMSKMGLLESFVGIKMTSFGVYSVQAIQQGQFMALRFFYDNVIGDCGQMRDFAAKTVSYSKEIEQTMFHCRCGEAWMISKIH